MSLGELRTEMSSSDSVVTTLFVVLVATTRYAAAGVTISSWVAMGGITSTVGEALT
jgi:hypothetical protein